MDSDLLYRLTAKLKYQLPNYDWSIARIDKQGDKCKYDAIDKPVMPSMPSIE